MKLILKTFQVLAILTIYIMKNPDENCYADCVYGRTTAQSFQGSSPRQAAIGIGGSSSSGFRAASLDHRSEAPTSPKARAGHLSASLHKHSALLPPRRTIFVFVSEPLEQTLIIAALLTDCLPNGSALQTSIPPGNRHVIHDTFAPGSIVGFQDWPTLET